MSFLTSQPKPKPIFLSDFAQAHKLPILRALDYYDESPIKSYQLQHLEVHKQFVPNLCGYHTLYNMIEICKILKGQDITMSPNEIFNPANFWKFHFECINYLNRYADMYGYERTNGPWTHDQVRWGDLERDYVTPLTSDNPKFQYIMESTKDFKISHMTFEFQFNRIVYSVESLNRMQKEIDSFVQAKNKPVHHIKMVMMGITNHWFLFVAHRYMDHVEFWMLDSKNRDYLTWQKEQIDAFLNEENEKRKKEQKPVLNSFKLWVSHNAMLDSQISVNLLANCFLGNTSLHHFVADSEVRMLTKSFLEMFGYDGEGDVVKGINDLKQTFKNSQSTDRASLIERAKGFVQGYYTTLKPFLLDDNKRKILYPKIRNELLEIISVLRNMFENSGNQHLGRLVLTFQQLSLNSKL